MSTAFVTAQPAPAPAARQADIDSFEYVWKAVRDNHWDPKLGGLDWQAVHDELRPEVEAAATREQARQVMSAMLERLKQTHFGIFPGDVYQALDPGDTGQHPANPGIDLRILEGHAIVTAVNPGSPAAARGIQPGWEILSVNGKEIAPVLQSIREQFYGSTLLDLRLTRAVLSRLQGKLGAPVTLDLLDGRGRKVSLDVDRATPRGKIAALGNFPGDYFWTEWRRLRGDVGYIRFNMFMDPEAVNKTMQEAVNGCRDCRGFVIDVRGNPGGIGGLATGVAGWFIDQSGLLLGTSYLRTATIKFVIFPRPQPFRGPLAVLVDGCSASTAEIFAGGLKDIKRARVFGTRTAGAALPSVIEKLPNGDGFQYAIANYISDGGEPLEGVGVIPDEELHLTRGHLLEGRDSVLEGALDWIQKAPKL
jgi:carboxyl-terminal processing protease